MDVQVKVLRPVYYRSRQLQAGDELSMPDEDERLMAKFGFVQRTEPAGGKPKRRTYKRRDMVAE